MSNRICDGCAYYKEEPDTNSGWCTNYNKDSDAMFERVSCMTANFITQKRMREMMPNTDTLTTIKEGRNRCGYVNRVKTTGKLVFTHRQVSVSLIVRDEIA